MHVMIGAVYCSSIQIKELRFCFPCISSHLFPILTPRGSEAGNGGGTGWVTWEELLRLVPVVLGVVHGVVWYPEGGPLGHKQLAATQHEVVGVADAHLSQPDWWIHPQHFLHNPEATELTQKHKMHKIQRVLTSDACC